MRIANSGLLVLLSSLTSACALFPAATNTWKLKGKWSTASFSCQDSSVEIGVELDRRIGGGDASPIRPAYLAIDGKRFDSVWRVGASMNSVRSNNRDHLLVLGNHSTYLDSISRKRRFCVTR